jgi:hypothetical protein
MPKLPRKRRVIQAVTPLQKKTRSAKQPAVKAGSSPVKKQRQKKLLKQAAEMSMDATSDFVEDTYSVGGQLPAGRKEEIYARAIEITSKMPHPWNITFPKNIDLALREIAAQMNEDESTALNAEVLVGYEFTQLALEMYPNIRHRTTYDGTDKEVEFADGGDVTDFSKAISASSRFKPRETIFFHPPVIGPNGSKLTAYTWAYEWTQLPNHEGEMVDKRVSDWTQAELSAETGRNIVHQYDVTSPDGTVKTMSSESVPIALGYTDYKQMKSLPNLTTAAKTLAKQKMKLGILEQQSEEYEAAKENIKKAGYPEIIKEKETDTERGDVRIVWRMGDQSVWEYSYGENPHFGIKPSEERLDALQSGYVTKELTKLGFPYSNHYSTDMYDLKRRIARQERKIEQILKAETLAEGGSFASGGMIKQDNDELYKKWKQLVNMTSSELEKFYDSEQGKKAGLSKEKADDLGISYGRESARWIMKMKDTPKSEWTSEMWKWAGKQVAFISRMKGNSGPLVDDNGEKTRKHTSLLIWGHNPAKKMADGGELDDLQQPDKPAYLMTKDEYLEKVVPLLKEYKVFLKKNNHFVKSGYGSMLMFSLPELLDAYRNKISIARHPYNFSEPLKNNYSGFRSEEQLVRETSNHINKNDGTVEVSQEIIDQKNDLQDRLIDLFGKAYLESSQLSEPDNMKSNKRVIKYCIDYDVYATMLEKNIISIEELEKVAASAEVKLPKKLYDPKYVGNKLKQDELNKVIEKLPMANRAVMLAMMEDIKTYLKPYEEKIFDREKARYVRVIEKLLAKEEVSEAELSGSISFWHKILKYEKRASKNVARTVTRKSTGHSYDVNESITVYYGPSLLPNYETELDNEIRLYIEALRLGLVTSITENFTKISKPIEKIDKLDVSLGAKGFQGEFRFHFKDGGQFDFRTQAIGAGGENIQVFHYRYITDFLRARTADGKEIGNPSLTTILLNFADADELKANTDPFERLKNATTNEQVRDIVYDELKKKSYKYTRAIKRQSKDDFGISFTLNRYDKVKGQVYNHGFYLRNDEPIERLREKALVILKEAGVQPSEQKMEEGGVLVEKKSKSNLTPEQQELVRTPAFKTWFGDWENDPENASKVVDENGEPLIVYHGTEREFTIYSNDKQPNTMGKSVGYYFTPQKGTARSYSFNQNYHAVFLNVRNLVKLERFSNDDDFIKLLGNDLLKATGLPDRAQSWFFFKDGEAYRDWKFDNVGTTVKNLSIQKGIDGYTFPERDYTTYVVFNPEQIKLADGTNTTFDPNNPDIRFADGGAVLEKPFEKWFLESKVVDKKGNPLVVYHGSPDLRHVKNEGVFKTRYEQNDMSSDVNAYFFTDSLSKAKSYADETRAFDYQNAEAGVLSCYLSLQNPLVLNAYNEVWRKFEIEIDDLTLKGTREIIKYAFDKGYDGVIVKNVRDYYNNNDNRSANSAANMYVAFQSNQIKLADGTNTTFDPNNPDIRYDDGGELDDRKAAILQAQPTDYVNVYHATASKHPVMENGLKMTSGKNKANNNSQAGYVYVSIYPAAALGYAKMHYPNEPVTIYEIKIPKNKLLPDTGAIKSFAAFNPHVKNTLADSISNFGLARILGNVQPYSLRPYGGSDIDQTMEQGGEINNPNMKVFNNNVKIGDKFSYGKHHKAEVVDILKHWSTKENDWTEDVTYVAKMLTGFATNHFDVPKASIVRNRIED